MQEIKKRSIVIASVLKPLNDTRMLEKMGRSLAANRWKVHLIGRNAEVNRDERNIEFHSVGSFKRLSFFRLLAPLKILRLLLSIRPTVLIINTHELLGIAVLFRLLSRTKIIYDIRENYYLNIRATNAFPKLIRTIVASFVRFNERLTSTYIKHFILAERCYQHELPFLKNRFTIVENKCQLPNSFKRVPSKKEITLLFSGTLDESTGVFQAIALTKALYKIDSAIRLKIVGYSALEHVRKKILAEAKESNLIQLVGLDSLVPHEKVFDAISTATAGLIYYPKSIHNERCIPTKLYEYLACELPILYQRGVFWSEMVEGCEGGIGLDFESLDENMLQAVLDRLKKHHFYNIKPQNVLWQQEVGLFLQAIEAM